MGVGDTVGEGLTDGETEGDADGDAEGETLGLTLGEAEGDPVGVAAAAPPRIGIAGKGIGPISALAESKTELATKAMAAIAGRLTAVPNARRFFETATRFLRCGGALPA